MFLAPSPMLPRACANSSRTHTLLATSHVSHSRLTPASAPFPRTQHAHSLHLEDVRRAAALEVLERVCATHRCTPPAPLRPAPLPMPSSHPRSASSLLQDVRELTEHLRASRLSSPARPLALHAPTLTPTRAPTFSPAAPPAASPFSPYASHASARAPTQVCVNLTQVCVNLTQVCVNLTQVCVNLTQVCVLQEAMQSPAPYPQPSFTPSAAAAYGHTYGESSAAVGYAHSHTHRQTHSQLNAHSPSPSPQPHPSSCTACGAPSSPAVQPQPSPAFSSASHLSGAPPGSYAAPLSPFPMPGYSPTPARHGPTMMPTHCSPMGPRGFSFPTPA
jgi:hypothetical protein